MKARAKFKLGNVWFEFESDATDLKEQILQLNDIKPRGKCDVCGNFQDFYFYTNKTDEGYTYVKVVCAVEDCKASSTLGTLKDNKGYYWRKFEKYVPSGNGKQVDMNRPIDL